MGEVVERKKEGVGGCIRNRRYYGRKGFRFGIRNDHIYEDRQADSTMERLELKKLLKRCKSNDLIFVKSLDRLGVSYEQLRENWIEITVKTGIDVCVIDSPMIDTRRAENFLRGRRQRSWGFLSLPIGRKQSNHKKTETIPLLERTFAEVVKLWKREKWDNFALITQDKYDSALNIHILPLLGELL